MSTTIKLRRGTAAQWTSANPTLADGEAGAETDTSKLKIGDGLTAWTSLAYIGGGLADGFGTAGSESTIQGAGGGAGVAGATLIIAGGGGDGNVAAPYHGARVIFNANASDGSAGVLELQGGDSVGLVQIRLPKFSDVPTSDPVVTGQVWNDAGTLKISAG